jgi:hypothetical protein
VALLQFELACNETHVHVRNCKFNFMVLGSTGNGRIYLVPTAHSKHPAVRKVECVHMAMQAFIWLGKVQFRAIWFGAAWSGSVLRMLI